MSDFNYLAFGERVRERRQELGMTQCKMAGETSVSTSFIGHIERGEKRASIETLVAISRCLDVSVDWLLTGQENRCDQQDCRLFRDLRALLESYGDRR